MLGFFKNWSLFSSFLDFFFLFPFFSSLTAAISSDEVEEGSSVELQELKSERTSWISLILAINVLFLGFRIGSWEASSSLAKEFLGGVLPLKEILCLLATSSFVITDQSEGSLLQVSPATHGARSLVVGGRGLTVSELDTVRSGALGLFSSLLILRGSTESHVSASGIFAGGTVVEGGDSLSVHVFSGVNGISPLQKIFLSNNFFPWRFFYTRFLSSELFLG